VRLSKYVKRHVNGTYTRRNEKKKRSYSRHMRKKERLQPIKIWHIVGPWIEPLFQLQILLAQSFLLARQALAPSFCPETPLFFIV
jgi:hypothetical protein